MAKAPGQASQFSPEYILYDKTQACKQRFKECFYISGLNYDDWLEQRCAEFNWWTSGLNADKKGPESLDVQLRLRPDVGDVISTALNGLESSLSNYYKIRSTNAKRSPSPWSDMSDNCSSYSSSGTCEGAEGDNQKTHDYASLDYDVYHEPRVYIKTNLEILVRIHIEIQRSGLKFKYQRADDALKQVEEAYQRQKKDFGERSALEGQNGDHERFRHSLTRLVLGNRYFQHPARLTKVQHRLINANVVRRNRLIYAGSAPKLLSQPEGEYREQPNPKGTIHQPLAIDRTKTVPAPQLQPMILEESTKGGKKPESLWAKPATAINSVFIIKGVPAPPGMTKTAAAKFSAREEYLDYPKCPVDHGPFPCPYCPTILTGEYAERDKWREHVAQDLCAFVCIFEDCNSPDAMFASTYEWMSHMARFHSEVDWVCPECVRRSSSSVEDASKFSFQSSELLKQHMLDSHSALDLVELDFLIETGKRTLRIQRVRCPLCRVGGNGIDGMASLPSVGREVGLVQLEEDEHIATHIHEFALQSLQELTLEDPQVSISHSPAKSNFQFNYRDLEEHSKISPTNQPSMYSLDDVVHMLDDLRDGIRGLLSEQGSLNQSSIKYRNFPQKENATLSHNMLLLGKFLDGLARGSTLQPRFKRLGEKDIDAFVKSLKECRVTLSQLSDLTVNATTKNSLHIQLQLLHNLKHSNEILQQAFASTLAGSMGEGSNNFSLTKTENFQPEEIKKSKTKLEEIALNALIRENGPEKLESGGTAEETETVETGSEKTETEYTYAGTEVAETAPSEVAETAPSEVELEIEENQSPKVQAKEAQNEEAEDGESEDEEDQHEEIQIEEAQTKKVQFEEDQTEEDQTDIQNEEVQPGEGQRRRIQAEEAQTKNPLTDDAPTNDAKPEEYEAKVSKVGEPKLREQEQKNVKGREPESKTASNKAEMPTTESSTTKPTDGPPAMKPPVTKWNSQEANVVGSGLKNSDPKAFKHTQNPTVDKGKGLATTETPILNEPRYNTPQDILEDMTEYIKNADLSSFFPTDSPYVSTLANNAFEIKNNKKNSLNRDVDIQGITRLNLYQPVLYCDDSTSMKVGTRVKDQKEMAKRITRISTSIVPKDYGTSLQFINHVRDVHEDKLSQKQVEAIMKSVKPTGHTAIGTNLKKKILQPLVYNVINSHVRLERPILVSCIIDGCPSHEPTERFKEMILECTQILKDNGYPPSTIRFQVSQIGNSSSADRYLKQLSHDPELSEVVYCTAQRLDEQFARLRDNEVMLERWLLRTLMEPIMGHNVGSLNLQHDRN